jgi:flagellar FliJ protein
MPQLRALALAIDQAKQQRNDAVAAFLKSQIACQGAQDQMAQLEGYARETESRWALGARSTADLESVQHYDHFMARLQQAVGMQQGVVAEQLQALATARQRWMAAEIRAASLQRLLDKRRAELGRIQNRLEQKQLEELSALLFRRLHENSETPGTPGP